MLNTIEPMKLGCEYAFGEHDLRLDSDCQLVFTNLRKLKRHAPGSAAHRRSTCRWSESDKDHVVDPQDVFNGDCYDPDGENMQAANGVNNAYGGTFEEAFDNPNSRYPPDPSGSGVPERCTELPCSVMIYSLKYKMWCSYQDSCGSGGCGNPNVDFCDELRV
jgi:hypothetical protein